MTPIAYTGHRLTPHCIGLVWLRRCLLCLEVTPDAVGIVVFGLWIGVVRND